VLPRGGGGQHTGVLTEILTNPALTDRLRGAAPAPAPEKTPEPEAAPSPPRPSGPVPRVRAWVGAGWSRARQVAGGVLRRATVAVVKNPALAMVMDQAREVRPSTTTTHTPV
jgi:hypothetical protein